MEINQEKIYRKVLYLFTSAFVLSIIGFVVVMCNIFVHNWGVWPFIISVVVEIILLICLANWSGSYIPVGKYHYAPEFGRLEIPGPEKFSQLDIQAEYQARLDKLNEMMNDIATPEEKYREYYNKRIAPFRPVGQHWELTRWVDNKPGKKYDEQPLESPMLDPYMIAPANQTYSVYLKQWMPFDYLKKMEKEEKKRNPKGLWGFVRYAICFGIGWHIGRNLTGDDNSDS